jgi:hypothetical protein
MPGKLYGYADVGRFGLGHGLLAWARCVVWCHKADVPVIAPRWLRLRIGPYLRRERDKRFYYRLFHRGRQVGGLHRARLLALAEKLSAEKDTPEVGWRPARETIVVFKNAPADNERKHFHEIVGANALVREALREMTRARFVPRPPREPHVAIHVRGGDFSPPVNVEALKDGLHNQRLPIAWYVGMLKGLREKSASDIPAVVYSDCTDDELAPLLAQARTTRSQYRAAISDMLAMSDARVLISSGSGFSRWGSYLGRVPRLCFPGQRAIRTLGPVGELDLEPECETARDIDAEFCMRALGRAPLHLLST